MQLTSTPRGRLQQGYLLVLAGVIVWLLARDWAVFSQSVADLSALTLTASILLVVLALLVQAQSWRYIQQNAPSITRPSHGQWLRFFLHGYLGRYVPGKVSLIIGRVLVLTPFGFSRGAVVYAALVENIMFLGGGLVFGSLCLVLLDPTFALPHVPPFGLAALLLVAGSAALISQLPEFTLRQAAKLFKREIALSYALPAADKAKVLIGAFSSNALLGAAFTVILLGLGAPITTASVWVYSAGAFSLSVVGGVLVLVAPSGAGVREAGIVFLLSPWVNAPVSLAAALIMRVVMLLAELGVYGLTFAGTRQGGRITKTGRHCR